MSRQPQQPNEPSLRDRLSASFLAAFEADFQSHGADVIERMRESHPERYAELAGKLIMTAEQPSANPYADADSMEDIGRVLLKEIGCDEFQITDDMVEQAVAANDEFLARLQQIAGGH